MMRQRNSLIATLMIALLYLPGCGGRPSTHDLMMRAASRPRPKDGDIDDHKTKVKNPEKVKKTGEIKMASAVVSADAAKTGQEKADQQKTPTEVLANLDDLELKPIQQRTFGNLTKDQRRAAAADNLAKIADALEKYHSEKGHFPARFVKTAGGLKTLSWRVELLPYLGYAKLYEKFDFQRPWNYEPNKTLLNYMPPEFMSPERNDLKTNFLLPAYRTCFFGTENGRRKQDAIKEDGLENTILLLEVNDDLAVEWIKPQDYEPKDLSNIKNDIGKLRGDGAFAVWANGWPVMLANALTNQQIANALTFDAGDGQLAGEVHRDIPISSGSDASNVVATSISDDAGSGGWDGNRQTLTDKPQPIDPTRVREPKPKATEISKAQAKLRKIFIAKIADAKEDQDKSKIADEMIDSAKTMVGDPAGAFVLQAVAMKMATDAGELKPVLSALDQRVGRFEVDTYEENMRTLLRFAESTSHKEASELDGDEFLRRSIPVIFAAIEDNDFVRGSTLARHCYRLRDQEPDEELMVSLNRLRVLMGSAKREYEKSADALAAYRSNPDDVESGAAFGRFLCFIKGDWKMGLPLVALGGNRDLQEIAKMDLRGATAYQQQIQIGDAWWKLASRTRNGVYRQAAQDRAASWYRDAWEFIPESLDRLHVKNRLDEVKDKPRSSPIALIQEMAKEVGVDLNVSLAAIADVGQRRSRIALNDDD